MRDEEEDEIRDKINHKENKYQCPNTNIILKK